MKPIQLFFLCVLFLSSSLIFSQNSEVTIETTKLSDNVYMLVGQGGNIGVSVGDDGVFTKDFLGTNNVTFERTEQGLALLGDKPWGERATFSGGQNTKIYN